MFLPLAALTLATLTALTTTAPPERLAPERPITAAGAAADTIIFKPLLLTTEQLESYFAVSKALQAYWFADSARKARLATLPKPIVLRYMASKFNPTVYDAAFVHYAALAKQDPAVAAIFKTNNFAPEQWGPMCLTIRQTRESINSTPYDSTSVLARNIAVLKPYVDRPNNVLQETIDRFS